MVAARLPRRQSAPPHHAAASLTARPPRRRAAHRALRRIATLSRCRRARSRRRCSRRLGARRVAHPPASAARAVASAGVGAPTLARSSAARGCAISSTARPHGGPPLGVVARRPCAPRRSASPGSYGGGLVDWLRRPRRRCAGRRRRHPEQLSVLPHSHQVAPRALERAGRRCRRRRAHRRPQLGSFARVLRRCHRCRSGAPCCGARRPPAWLLVDDAPRAWLRDELAAAGLRGGGSTWRYEPDKAAHCAAPACCRCCSARRRFGAHTTAADAAQLRLCRAHAICHRRCVGVARRARLGRRRRRAQLAAQRRSALVAAQGALLEVAPLARADARALPNRRVAAVRPGRRGEEPWRSSRRTMRRIAADCTTC